MIKVYREDLLDEGVQYYLLVNERAAWWSSSVEYVGSTDAWWDMDEQLRGGKDHLIGVTYLFEGETVEECWEMITLEKLLNE